VFGRYSGVFEAVQGVLCFRNGSGRAGKWTSVSPCVQATVFLTGSATAIAAARADVEAGAYTRPR
jgi:hypothetical protein